MVSRLETSPFMLKSNAEHLHHTVTFTGVSAIEQELLYFDFVVMDLAASSNQIQASVVYSFSS